jgi:hypothetical protein
MKEKITESKEKTSEFLPSTIFNPKHPYLCTRKKEEIINGE